MVAIDIKIVLLVLAAIPYGSGVSLPKQCNAEYEICMKKIRTTHGGCVANKVGCLIKYCLIHVREVYINKEKTIRASRSAIAKCLARYPGRTLLQITKSFQD
ncbi:hypothetical protein ScPMuIL_010347 [Solemya velum]